MKQAILIFIKILSYAWRIIPKSLRRQIFFFLFVLESRAGRPDSALRQLFLIWDKLDDTINERAMAYGKGSHPKIRLTNYQKFFSDRIKEGDRVLDIGCFNGDTAAYVAAHNPNATVAGVEIIAERLEEAKRRHHLPNLSFFHADATKKLPNGKWNVVILSNVLEHIDKRTEFLNRIAEQVQPDTFLIRLPCFNRYWYLPMRKELGIYYFSDTTHFIEPSFEDFHAEMKAANLTVVEELSMWGEIWAVCKRELR